MIGRKKEISELMDLYNNKRSELVVLYGRRRIGKTYLINETFKDKFTFKHTALLPNDFKNGNELLSLQLELFYKNLVEYGLKDESKPKDWFDAFILLEKLLEQKEDGDRLVVFIDELPWLDTKKSYFIKAFEYFWNNFGCAHENLMFIICGSATSWIENELINNTRGLYGRVTYEIKLNPFSLKESKELLESNGVNYSLYDITQAYMIFGGIPYYLNYIDKKYSLSQNVDNLFFKENGVLLLEYDQLFNSIFTFSEKTKLIIKLLGSNNLGFTREDIAKKTNISDGGGLSKYLNSLIASNFIIKYVPFGFSKREPRYKLVDPFCIFYIRFVLEKSDINNLWTEDLSNQKISSWRGYAFENVCFNHIDQIKFVLGISSVSTRVYAFFNEEDGNQMDLVIDRKDNIINLCEIKFYSDEFKITKDYFLKINRRSNLVREKISKKYSVRNTLISTYGIYKNEYYYSFSNSITLDDLFKF